MTRFRYHIYIYILNKHFNLFTGHNVARPNILFMIWFILPFLPIYPTHTHAAKNTNVRFSYLWWCAPNCTEICLDVIIKPFAQFLCYRKKFGELCYQELISAFTNRRVGSIWRCHLTNIGYPIVEIRQFFDRLISPMGFPLLVRWHLSIEWGPRPPMLLVMLPIWCH